MEKIVRIGQKKTLRLQLEGGEEKVFGISMNWRTAVKLKEQSEALQKGASAEQTMQLAEDMLVSALGDEIKPLLEKLDIIDFSSLLNAVKDLLSLDPNEDAKAEAPKQESPTQ